MANVILKGDAVKRLQAKYGESFPDPKKGSAKEWQAWFKDQREQQDSYARDRRLHWSRHRNFRIGNQWISTRDGRTWREPGADKNTLRPVNNQIGPALDFRLGVIFEQKPGFRHDVSSGTIEAREKAEAQQYVAEYYLHKLKAARTFRDASWHAQSDGVSFVQVWYDPMGGKYLDNATQMPPEHPLHQQHVDMGYEQDDNTGNVILPLADDGSKILPPGSEVGQVAEGDLACRVVLAHDTLVNAEARMLNGQGADAAKWFLVRRPRDIYAARIETNNEKLEAETFDQQLDPTDFPTEGVYGFSRNLPPFPAGSRTRFKEGVYDYTIYIAPDGQDMPEGMWRRVIGDALVDQGDELPGGVIPFARFTDGSPDPSFYPRPVMSDYLGDQIAINALEATIMQHGRILGIGRLLALKGTLLSETYNAVVGSVLEYEGIKPEQLQSMKTSADLWQLLQYKIKKLEDKTGFNDLARGQVLGQSGGGMQDVSGRAVLGAMEMLERSFGPMVQAAAEGASEFAEIVVKYAAWTFDTPRMIEAVGGRQDLGKLISREEIEGDCSVYCDPATMMPMPAQLREEQLNKYLAEGKISLATWAQRSPYGIVRDLPMGDLDHWNRAQLCNTLIEERGEEFVTMTPQELYLPENLPILWQDDPQAHLVSLNEIILNEKKEWPLRQLACDRSTIYEQLAQAKADPAQPVPAEVLGVPLNRLRAQLGMFSTASAGLGGGIQAPPTAAGAAPADSPMPTTPSTTGDNPAAGMSMSPQPLGTVGSVEQGLRK